MIGRKSKIALLGLSGFLIFGFQNCGGGSVKFTNAPTLDSAASVSPPAPAPLKCPLGQTSLNSACVPCNSFVALTANGTGPGYLGSFVVPPPDATQTCYYVHVINSVDLGSPVPSSDWQTYRNDIYARDHDVSHGNASPRVIGSTANADGSINTGAVGKATFTLLGQRTVSLSGSASGNVNMLVDNFILLEMNSKTFGLQNLAEGTADAIPWLNPTVSGSQLTGPITVNNDPILNYVSFAAGGTTNITPVDISSFFPLNDSVSVTTTGLDCGGVGDISDIYILFQ
jgi:hypothetical protein